MTKDVSEIWFTSRECDCCHNVNFFDFQIGELDDSHND